MTAARDVSAAEAARDVTGLRAHLAAAPEASRLTALGLGAVLLGEGMLERVADLVAELRDGDGDIAVLIDRRPMAAPGGDAKAIVQEALAAAGPVRPVAIGGADADVHADADTVAAAVEAVRGSSVLVTIGSGTVSDIGKVASARLDGLAHIVVQTAASVNGFADDQSVLVVDGVKRTTPSRWPDRLVIDTGVVALAPPAMNQAGLGDLLATYTAPADWLLARLVGQDASFSPAAVALARDHVDAALDAASGIPGGAPEAIETLAAALTLSGIAMGVAGRTAPGSGMEHTVSHVLEMTDADEGALHGAKVGVLSVFSACLWERVRRAVAGGALADLRFPDTEEMRGRIHAAFDAVDPTGAMAAECWRDYGRKLARWTDARPATAGLAEQWPAFDAEVSRLLAAPERLIAALRAAGAPTRLRDLGIDPDRSRWALEHCHLMRDRFTIADLAFLLGLWDRAGVEALVQQVTELGCGL